MMPGANDTRDLIVTTRYTIRYETSEPAPNQWIAVGTVILPCGCRMLRVGRGHSRVNAIVDLKQRADDTACPHTYDLPLDPLDIYDDIYADVTNV
jgi:hypothetical protein